MFRSAVSYLGGQRQWTTSFEVEFARDAHEPSGHLSHEEVRKAWPYESIGLESMAVELQRDLGRRHILGNQTYELMRFETATGVSTHMCFSLRSTYILMLKALKLTYR